MNVIERIMCFVFILGGIPELLSKVQKSLSSCYVCAFSACQKSCGINNCNEILVFCNTSELRSNKQISQAPCEMLTRGVLTLGFSVARSP